MTQFELGNGCVLGLMPKAGIKRLLGEELFVQEGASPKAELYLRVDKAEDYCDRARKLAQEVSPLEMRNWGDLAAYYLDPDGHLIALASC